MKAFGIEFAHRRAEEKEYVAKDYAEFTAFAAMCDGCGVAKYVRGVFFDTKWQGFNLDVDPAVEGTDIGVVIRWCASKTLPQFELFGYIGNKNDE